MASWEKELWDAVANNDLSRCKTILNNDKVRRNGDLARKEWKEGEASLHLAAARGSVEMIRAMAEAGFNINSYGSGGGRATSLHWAVYHNHVNAVRFLLSLGADQSLKGKRDARSELAEKQVGFLGTIKGKGGQYAGTPLDWAKRRGYADIVLILEEQAGKSAGVSAFSPATLSSFDTMDPMTKLIQKPGKIQEFESAKRVYSEIQHLQTQMRRLQEKIVRAEEETRRDKETLGAMENELKKQQSQQPSIQYMKVLEKQLDEIEAISVSLRGLVLPSSGGESRKAERETCPVCFLFPNQVFSCQTCGHWVCQDCRYKIAACPQCRQDLRGKPMMRNMAVERMLRDN